MEKIFRSSLVKLKSTVKQSNLQSTSGQRKCMQTPKVLICICTAFKCLTWYEDRKKLTQANDRVVFPAHDESGKVAVAEKTLIQYSFSLRMHKKTNNIMRKNKIIGEFDNNYVSDLYQKYLDSRGEIKSEKKYCCCLER